MLPKNVPVGHHTFSDSTKNRQNDRMLTYCTCILVIESLSNWLYSLHMMLYFSVLQHSFSAVMHFAGLKAVGESVAQPLRYYRVNLTASMNLIEVCCNFCHLI